MEYVKIKTVQEIMNQSMSKLKKYSVLDETEITDASKTFGLEELYVSIAACCADTKQDCFEYLYNLSDIEYDGVERSDVDLFQYYYKSVMTTLIHTYQNKILRIASGCEDYKPENDNCRMCPKSPFNAIPLIAKIMESEQISLDKAIIKYQLIIRNMLE